MKTNAVEVPLHRALGRLKVLLDPGRPGGGGAEPRIVRTATEKVLPDA